MERSPLRAARVKERAWIPKRRARSDAPYLSRLQEFSARTLSGKLLPEKSVWIWLSAASRRTIEAIALSENYGCSGLRDSNFPADFH